MVLGADRDAGYAGVRSQPSTIPRSLHEQSLRQLYVPSEILHILSSWKVAIFAALL